jgi:hypothetical protein
MTQEVGFFEVDHEVLAQWLLEGLGSSWSIGSAPWQSLDDAVIDLAPAVPLSRYACINLENWALAFNNGPGGSDVGVLPSQAARDLNCQAVRAVCVGDDSGYPARILEVYGPTGEPPLAIERSIAAANDGGRWIFEVSGQPFAFEDLGEYQKRVKSQRFTCDMLHEYLRHLGVPVDAEPAWSSALLLERR